VLNKELMKFVRMNVKDLTKKYSSKVLKNRSLVSFSNNALERADSEFKKRVLTQACSAHISID